MDDERREFEFGFERLDCYRVAVEVARWAAKQSFPPHRRHLQGQFLEAVDSVHLNIAEGAGHPPGNAQRNHFRIALGSAGEACSVLNVVDLPEGPENQQKLRRVGAMLARMGR